MTTNENFELKLKILAEYLETDTDSISANQSDDYLVCTDKEADEAVKESVLDSLWAFRSSFIVSHMAYKPESYRERDSIEKALDHMQGNLCESANCIVKSMIKDLDHFVDDAVSSDGRGHFLAQYDGDEHEVEIDGIMYLVYRQN